MLMTDCGMIAQSRFYEMMSRQRWQRLRCWATGRPQRTPLALRDSCWQRTITAESFAGMRCVPVDRIVGSECRWSDFDSEFRPRLPEQGTRWVRLTTALLQRKTLPPVWLIELDGQYYVRDGHHRISAARHAGAAFIDAEVTRLTTRPVAGTRIDRNHPIRKQPSRWRC